ncbi:MAG: DUF1499 domain-containing protein [Xanthomonadales bacterium]|nr:hypothetical protein [Xanthomonadales bacterium]MCC6591689.1 DUF1499 domain-containing protein [Xanthomonadales bacterium]
MRIALIVLLTLVLLVLALFAWRGHTSRHSPPTLDLVAGRLRPCPDTPNCVGSESVDGERRIEALPYRGDRAASERALAGALGRLERAQIQRRQGDYWHATQRSALFGFVDDLEFRFDDRAGLVHLRSASRVGYSDLGANRKRAETLRAAYLAQP